MSGAVAAMVELPHKAIGAQPYLVGPHGKCSASRYAEEGPTDKLMEEPLIPHPTAQNHLKGLEKFTGQRENLRHSDQMLSISLVATAEAATSKSLENGRRDRRNWVLSCAFQSQKEHDDAIASQQPYMAASPRARNGPKDAKAVTPGEISGQYKPVATAIMQQRAETSRQELAVQRQTLRTVDEMDRETVAAMRDRASKQQQLGKQADNLSARRNHIDAQKVKATSDIDKHNRAHVAQRAEATAKAASLQKRIDELAAKKEAARRQAWLSQAHPPNQTTPRWNETLSSDQKLKTRTITRTADAGHPAPPTPNIGLAGRGVSPRIVPVPSPRLSQKAA